MELKYPVYITLINETDREIVKNGLFDGMDVVAASTNISMNTEQILNALDFATEKDPLNLILKLTKSEIDKLSKTVIENRNQLKQIEKKND